MRLKPVFDLNSSSLKLFHLTNHKYASHGLNSHNRKYIYDAIYNDYIPIYFDGNILPEAFRSATRAYSIIKGDKKISSIAAASIVAKVSRDFFMKSLNIRFPGYGWEKNVGYGVEQHKAGIYKLGVNTEHRRSFRPIYNMLCL